MITNTTVTIWKLDNSDGTYIRKNYPANVFLAERLSKSGIKQRGYYNGTHMTVRVPAIFKVSAGLGDFVRIGEHYDPYPDRINDLKIIQITRNEIGTNPHTKLLCGRVLERS